MVNPDRLNNCLLITGLVGGVVCAILWRQHRSRPWLIGVGLFGYLVVSSLVALWRHHA